MYRQHLTWKRGRGTYELTRQLNEIVAQSKIVQGLCSRVRASYQRVADRLRKRGPERAPRPRKYAARLVPDGDPEFSHDSEGPDDMPAHIRSILTLTSLTIPVENRRCDLGTWQGVVLWEHRTSPHRRHLTVTVTGE